MNSSREFVGARLELARAFHELTLKQLADQVSVSFGLLAHYEKGLRKQPAENLVAALAEALKVAPGFFFEPLLDPWREVECSFRRRVATPEFVKKRARSHGTLIGLVLQELSQHVKFPAYDVPALPAASDDEIESAAQRVREHWKLGFGPIVHVSRLAERSGVILIQNLQHADKIDAFARRGRFNVIVLNTTRQSTSRWVFDIAHELGHFVLHHGAESGSKETEHQANRFASAFLLPKKSFAREFKARPFSWAHVFELKRRWCVSAGAMIRRAYDLSLLDAITYRRSYQQMSVQGWLKSEPYEPTFAGPEWLASAFDVVRKRRGLTPLMLCERVQLAPETFEAVTGVPVEAPQPIRFRPKLIG